MAWRGLTILGVLLIVLLLAETIGVFNEANILVDSQLPHGGLLVELFSATASIPATVVYVALLATYEASRNGRVERETLLTIVGLALVILVVAMLKLLTKVPRPGAELYPVNQSLLDMLDYYAFPSGHTSRASLLAYFLGKRWRHYRIAFWAWAIGIALSRLLLHVHWLSDVVYALLLGAWIGMAVEVLFGSKATREAVQAKPVETIP